MKSHQFANVKRLVDLGGYIFPTQCFDLSEKRKEKQQHWSLFTKFYPFMHACGMALWKAMLAVSWSSTLVQTTYLTYYHEMLYKINSISFDDLLTFQFSPILWFHRYLIINQSHQHQPWPFICIQHNQQMLACHNAKLQWKTISNHKSNHLLVHLCQHTLYTMYSNQTQPVHTSLK